MSQSSNIVEAPLGGIISFAPKITINVIITDIALHFYQQISNQILDVPDKKYLR